MSEKRKAAFFDRDGTICKDTGYAYDPDDIRFIAGMPEKIREYNENGYLVIVITNQSGIARGFYTEEQMRLFHESMNRRLEKEYGAHIDDFYFCPHLPEITGECECRKPKPGMFLKAISEYNIDPKQSVSYGDSDRDEIASRAANIEQFFRV